MAYFDGAMGLSPSMQAQFITDPRQALAAELMKTGSSTAPVATPLAGLARALQAGLGGYQQGQVREEYKARDKARSDTLARAHAAGLGGPITDMPGPNLDGSAGYTMPGTGKPDVKTMAAILAGNSDTADTAEKLYMAQMAEMIKPKEMKTVGAGDSIFDPTTGKVTFTNGAKAPSGYEYGSNGQLQAIPGGPADLANQAKEEAARNKKDTALRQGVEKYSKQLTDSGIADLLNSVTQFNNSTQNIEDLPGFGATYAAPDFAISEAGRDLRQTVATIRNNILRARSGGAVTPQEADRLLEELGEGFTKNDAQLKQGIANIEAILREKLTNINAGYGKDVLDQYVANGGNVRLDRLTGPQAGNGLQVGTIEDGYRFKGGNPSDPNSWEKAQ